MVPVAGGEVWAQDTGYTGAKGADAGSQGGTIVLLHPGWGDSRIWDQVLARLPDRHRVVRYDTRGYGSPGADHMLPLRAPDLVADLISSHAE
jgi:pimeloyl-ACP methyl ester carboxylesterase